MLCKDQPLQKGAMKAVNIVGARTNIIKIAPVVRSVEKYNRGALN